MIFVSGFFIFLNTYQKNCKIVKTCDVLICCNLIGESIRCLVWIRWPHCPNCDWQEIVWCHRMVKSQTICIYWGYFDSKRLISCPSIKSTVWVQNEFGRSNSFWMDLEKLTQRAWMWLNPYGCEAVWKKLKRLKMHF